MFSRMKKTFYCRETLGVQHSRRLIVDFYNCRIDKQTKQVLRQTIAPTKGLKCGYCSDGTDLPVNSKAIR